VAVRKAKWPRVNTLQLSLLLAGAVALIGAGIRWSRPAVALAGLAAAGLVALGHLTARFGPEQVWFRAPTFYVAIVLLLAGLAWWVRRPAPSLLRFGAPAAIIALASGFLVLALLNGRGAPPSMLMPTRNQAAPDIAFIDSAGESRRLSDLQGDVVLINFWATWCAPCRHEMPMLAKLQREYEPRRFRVLYLSLEEPQVLDAFLAKNHFDGIQGRIDSAPPFYGAGRFYPLSYLVGRGGTIVARWSGRPGEAWLSDTIERQL
jgi:thiol-disulfide isomerase/thioredoxin